MIKTALFLTAFSAWMGMGADFYNDTRDWTQTVVLMIVSGAAAVWVYTWITKRPADGS